MDKLLELAQSRKEAQAAILALKDQIAPVVLLNFLGRAFKEQGAGYWVTNVVAMNLLMLAPWLLLGRVLNETDKTSHLLTSGVMVTELIIAGLMMNYANIQDLFRNVAAGVVGQINNAEDLSKLVGWFKATWSRQSVFVFVLGLWLMWVFLGVVRISLYNGEFLGFGFLLSVAFMGVFAGVGFYATFWLGLLAFNLGTYQYEVDAYLSADSEIVRNISETLARQTYSLAAYFAVFTLFGSSRFMDADIRRAVSLPFLFIVWAVITAQFILTRRTLAKIVNGARGKTLKNLRAKINALGIDGDLAEKETAEKFQRLTDIYERVKAAKVDALDLRTLTAFLSQLALPLLGLLLGNLDELLNLLTHP